MGNRNLGIEEIAWRGFVTLDGDVIAWPTMLADHNQFHRTFGTTDVDFSARWRQWGPGAEPDIDPPIREGVEETIKAFLTERK